MKPNFRTTLVCLTLVLTLATPWRVLRAQRLERLPTRIDSHKRMILRASRNPRIDTLVSEGPVEETMPVSGISLRFQPTYEQSVELERLLEDQQNPSSPLYHAWLTPEEYGERFGLGSNDFAKVGDWIASQGFQIDDAAKSRTYISFSGTAAHVRNTFGTELHRYKVDGKAHFANTRDIEIPADLESLILGVQGLDDFPTAQKAPSKRHANSDNGSHSVTPGDLAVIYNLAPMYKKGITGKGIKIVVPGHSKFNMQDVRDFRDRAGLPPSDPKVMLTPGMQDPGYTDAVTEALLDLEYAGGAAPDATLIYLYGNNANTSAQYAVDQNLAPIISESFSLCEKREQNWAFFRNLARQAAAQGITWVASSGDTGAAGCESQNSDSFGVSGLAVNVPASAPEVTAVGGTTFAEGPGNYWAATTGNDGTSALSYIPEKAWNESGGGNFLLSSGGGVSAAYARPPWQTGPGLPNDNARHVPDVSFTADNLHDPYLIIETGGIVETGGTSAATPFFAGVLALLNQYVVENGVQAKPGLGNINPRLYQLAQTTRGVFHDVTVGSNIVPCKGGTPDCINGQYGYNAGPGYDNATGLGSLDVANFIQNWATTKSTPKTTSVVVPSVEPTPVYQQAPDADGYNFYYTVRVSETGGGPTALTAFSMDGYDLSRYISAWFGSANLPSNGSMSADLRSKDLDVPSEHTFVFGGVDNSGQKWSKQISVPFRGTGPGNQTGAAMSLTSDPAVVVKIGKGDPNCSTDHPFGQQLTLRELNGSAVKLSKFIAGGFDYSAQIAAWFGSTNLPASGTLQAHLCWQLDRLPVTLSYEMDGMDGSGRQIQATLKVDFSDLFDKKGGVASPEAAAARPAATGATNGPAQPGLIIPPMRRPGTIVVTPQPGKARTKTLGRRPGVAPGN